MRQGARPVQPGANYFPSSDGGCPQRLGGNVKVTQNCLNLSDADLAGRGQASNEPYIAIDPRDPSHQVGSSNDYRRGDSSCGSSYSLNKGRDWTDTEVPHGFSRGTAFGKPREYWQAAGDTSVAWDSKGNAYLSCLVFQRGIGTSPNPDASRGLLLFRSTGNGGASWNFTGRVTELNADPNADVGLAVDKQFMSVDANPGSPFQDRIYVTWTEFAPTAPPTSGRPSPPTTARPSATGCWSARPARCAATPSACPRPGHLQPEPVLAAVLRPPTAPCT
jgi:hypothetical protein